MRLLPQSPIHRTPLRFLTTASQARLPSTLASPPRRMGLASAAVIGLVALTGASQAQGTSTTWDMVMATPSLTGTNLAGSAITSGNNNGTTVLLNATSASTGYPGASGTTNAGAASRVGALNTASDGSAYFEVTLTPQNGATLTLNEISFGSRSTGTGPQAYTIRTSGDSYATDFATGSLANNSTWVLKSNTGLSLSFSSARTFRIYGHGGAGNASANTANWRIDDLTFTMAPPAGTPTVTVVSSLPAFAAFLGTPSASQSFSVTGSNLTAGIDLAASSGFEVSSDGTTFGGSVSLPSTGGTGYARVAASGTAGPISGNITLTSAGATAKTISLTGTVSDPNVLTLTLTPSSIPENSVTPAVGTVSIPVARPAALEVTLTNANPAAATIALTTVTIPTGELTATFNVTPIAAPTSFVANSTLITASADGLVSGTATLQVTNVDVPPTVVIPLTTTPYAQNFDSLGNSAYAGVVSQTVGTVTSLGALAGTSMNGWYVTKTAGTGTVPTSISPDDGTLNSGSAYNYGAVDATDRSLGLLASGSNTLAMGALITNNTGVALTSLNVSMTAEFWRSSTLNQNTLAFGYGKIAGTITTENFLSVANASVLPLTALNIVGPEPVSSGSNGPLDGNNSVNQVPFNNVSVPIALAPGETAFIRWQDFNDTGNDAALAIDNLIITDGSSASSGFALWIESFFPENTDPNTIGFDADPDFDGIPNGVEALIGSNPDSPGVFATTELTKDGNTFTFLYPQDKSVPFGVTADYEWSTDLANWQASGNSFGGVTVTLGDELFDEGLDLDLYQVTATVTAGTATRLFIRVLAEN